MSAGAIGGIAALQAPPSAQKTNAFADLSSEQFIKILTTELSQQDPFKPNDSAAILNQLSSLRNIESQASLQTQLKSLVNQNAVSSAGGMIGQFVKGVDVSGQQVEGVVQSLVIENGKPVLKLDNGKRIEASRLTDVGNLGNQDSRIVQQLLRNLIILNSSALVGKMVSGFDASKTSVEGVVTSVNAEKGDLVLELDTGQRLSAGAVTRFSNVKK